MKIGHFSKLMKLNIHLLLCSKRHYIDEIEHPPSPICGEKPQFESNVTSFQFRQNASAGWWPIGHHLASAFWRGSRITRFLFKLRLPLHVGTGHIKLQLQ